MNKKEHFYEYESINVIQNSKTTFNKIKKNKICAFTLISLKPRPKIFITGTVVPLD